MVIKNNGTIIECKDIAKTFVSHKQKLDVFKNLNLQVSRGEVLVIQGKSGAGKSTLSNVLSGIETVSAGEVLFDGKPYHTLNNDKIAKLRQKNIGIIFQNFNLISSWTAYENIEAAIAPNDLTKLEQRKLIESYLDELGMLSYQAHTPNELSIGQQQRVAVIRSIINNPQLLLGDEPTGDVDNETGAEIMELIQRIINKNGATMIVTTHGEFPLNYVDRVLTLVNGNLASS